MLTPVFNNHAHEPRESQIDRPHAGIHNHSLPVELRHPFAEKSRMSRGSFTALPTPFNGGVAEKAFASLVAWQIDQGVEGLVVCSAAGEGPTLTAQERKRLIEIAVETADGRAPIIAATGTNCTQETVALTRAAETAGAAAALVVTPYYNAPNQYGLYLHFREIAHAVGLPIIIENDPARTGIDVQRDTLLRLAEIPNIVGVEHTSGDPVRLADKDLSGNFIQLSGDDRTSVLFQMGGGDGSISIVANIVPKLWVEMQHACRCKDWGRASTIQTRLLPLLSALRLETNPGPLKYALSFLRPWFSPELRLPLVPVTYETGNAIVTALMDLDLIR